MAAKNLMDLTGRVVAVIGGTSGLGRELAVGLATAGADVVPTGRREAMVDEVCAEVERAGGRTLRRVCDIGSRESVDQFRDDVLAELAQTQGASAALELIRLRSGLATLSRHRGRDGCAGNPHCVGRWGVVYW